MVHVYDTQGAHFILKDWISDPRRILEILSTDGIRGDIRWNVIERGPNDCVLIEDTDGKFRVTGVSLSTDNVLQVTLVNLKFPIDRMSTVGKVVELTITHIGLIIPKPEGVPVSTIEQERAELEEIIRHYSNERIPGYIGEDKKFRFHPTGHFIASWTMAKEAVAAEIILVRRGDPEFKAVIHGAEEPNKKELQAFLEGTDKARLDQIVMGLTYFKTNGIPCDVDEEGRLHHMSDSSYLVVSWSKSHTLPLMVVLSPTDHTEQMIDVGVTSVNVPARATMPKPQEQKQEQAVRSADADAVAFHLISPHALERLAARYQLGLEKYNAYNWTKGFSHGQVLNHTQRHINHYLAGDRREDHLAAAAWGLFTLMHYEDTNTGTPDLKRYVETYDGITPKGSGT
jgi:hypothetical protein